MAWPLARFFFQAALGLLLLCALEIPSEAHGGVFPPPPPYRGPGDTTPSDPKGGDPSSLPPGALPASAETPAPPGTASASTPLAPPGASTSFSPASAHFSATLPDLLAWTWWWEFNKEAFLNLRARLLSALPETGSDDFFLGRWDRAGLDTERQPPTPAQIRDLVLPALLSALQENKSNEVAAACLIAVARIGEDRPSAERTELAEVMRPFLANANQEVAETAAVGLGILGSEGAALLLADLALDTTAGRHAVGTSEVGWRARSFAAYALGLIGAQTSMEDVRRFVAHKLARVLETETTSTGDLGIACVLALGRVPLEWSGEPQDPERKRLPPIASSREAEVLHLLRILEDPRRHRLVRAHVPTALAWLLSAPGAGAAAGIREDVVAELVRALGRRSEPIELRQSCALALGLLGDDDRDPSDQGIRAALRAAIDDPLLRPFSLLSLGRVCGRQGPGEAADIAPVRKELLALLERGDDAPSHWAALGLALFVRSRVELGSRDDLEILDVLLQKLRASRSAIDSGAYSIACGLVGDPDARDALLQQLRKTDEEQGRGYAILGLALVQAREVVEEIRALVEESRYRPLLLREGAIALGILGDRKVVDLLGRELVEAQSLAAQASVAQALGRIGDASAIGPLIEVLQQKRHSERARAFAAAALGIVSDGDLLPWNTFFSLDVNYAAAPPTLYDQNGFGILNLL